MHVLQPKHSKLKPEDADELLKKLNISLPQLPKIKLGDAGLPKDTKIGDIIKIERKNPADKKVYCYYRLVVK